MSLPGARFGRNDLGPTAVVGDSVGDVEQGSESALGAPTGVKDADLICIGVDADVRTVHLADQEHAHRLIAVVAITMSTALATWEGDDLPFRQLFPAGCGPKTETSVENDEELFALDVVMEDHFVAWSELVDACAEMFGASGLGNSGCENPVCTDGERIIKIAHIGRVRGAGCLERGPSFEICGRRALTRA